MKQRVGQFVNYCFEPNSYNIIIYIRTHRERERALYKIMISKQSTVL